MNYNGITRRIDDLGRIVLPKEIRDNLGIREGEHLLISTEDNKIIIKKYSKVETLSDKIQKYTDIINSIIDTNIVITDREKVLYSSRINNVEEKNLDKKLKNIIDNRESYFSNSLDKFFDITGYYYIVPIITSSDSIGLVIIINNKVDENLKNIANLLSKLISS